MRPLLLLLLLASPAFAQVPGYGELARTTALSAADEHRLGKGYLDMMSWMYGTLDDPALVAGIEETTRRIVANSDKPDMVFNIVVLDDPTVNAAALPGGYLMVNKGLIDALTPDQVAFVIAHEISHVQLRHFAVTMNMTAALEVLEVARTSHASDAGADLQAQHMELARMTTSYSRHLELESDLYGMLYAVRAGFPKDSGTGAMEAMRAVVGEVPAFMADQSSHPTFGQRIEELTAGLETVMETHGQFDAGIAYARAGEYEPAIHAFQSYLTGFPKSAAGWSNLGTCYLRSAVQAHPDDPWHDDLPLYLRSDVVVRGVDKVAAGRARDAFAKALAIDPNRDAALGNLGVLARLEGDPKAAAELLGKALELDPKYAGYHNNLGNVFASKGDLKTADKHWSKALRLDAKATYAKANQALAATQKGKKKEAIGLWRELEAVDKYRAQAATELAALGESPLAPPKVAPVEEEPLTLEALLASLSDEPVAAEPVGSVGSAEPMPEPVESTGATGKDRDLGAVKLGGTLAEFTAALGTPDYSDAQADGYYAFASWDAHGLSAVYLDDVATSVELFQPATSKTARGIGIGAKEEAVRNAYGEPTDVFGDRDMGFYSLTFASLGHSFFFDDRSQVLSISVWTL